MKARAVPRPQQANGWLSTDGKFHGSKAEAEYYNALLVLRSKISEHEVIKALAPHEQEYITQQVLKFAQDNAEILVEYCSAWEGRVEPELLDAEPAPRLTEETIVEGLRNGTDTGGSETSGTAPTSEVDD